MSRLVATDRSVAESSSGPSWLAMPANGGTSGTNSVSVARLSKAQKASANRGWVLTPVPTAVPPWGSARRRSRQLSMRARFSSNWCSQVRNSCPRVRGMASIRWVRPVLTTPSSSLARASKVAQSLCRAGSKVSRHCNTALTRMAVGITSLLDCPRFTSSLGCTWTPACSHRRAITSLAFMLLLVPEPVWNTSTGNWSLCAPEATACAADWMASAFFRAKVPSSAFAPAAANLIHPRAEMNGAGSGQPLRGKLSIARWVWAPQSAFPGT